MGKKYIYPFALGSVLLTIGSAFCIVLGAIIPTPLWVNIQLFSVGIILLCINFYTNPLIVFNTQQITIYTLFPGRVQRIRWNEVQRISAFELGSIFYDKGIACHIYTAERSYAIPARSPGMRKLYTHWESIHPSLPNTDLHFDQIPVGIYRQSFWRSNACIGLIISLPLFVYLCSVIISSDGTTMLLFSFLGIYALLYMIYTVDSFNYYELTSTSLYMHSAFPFWNYQVRWEDVRGMRIGSYGKYTWVMVCNRHYHYKCIPVGYTPKNLINKLREANVPII